MRRVALLALGFVGLCPTLASADALDGAFMALQFLAAIWGLALLLMLLSVLAYRQPASQTLRLLNLVGIGISLLLGAAWLVITTKMGSSGGLASLGSANPFLTLSLPLAAWLGGASRATYDAQPRARQWAVAVALVGAQLTGGALHSLVMRWLLPTIVSFELTSYPYVHWTLGLLVAVGMCWLVLRQVQRRQPLGWQLPVILKVAALATILSVLYSYLPILLYMSNLDAVWFTQAAVSFFTYGLCSCAVGALVIWLNQRRYRP